MQGPSGFLNVLTIPVGATIYEPRVVIDGIRGAVFVYGAGVESSPYDVNIVQVKIVPGSLSGNFNNPTTAGNLVVCGIIAIGTQASAPSATNVELGSVGSFTLAESAVTAFATGGNWFYAGGWVLPDCPAGQTAVAVTGVTGGLEASNSNFGLVLLEVSGLVLSSPVDQVSANNNGSSTTLSFNSGTTADTTVPVDLAVGLWSAGDAVTGLPAAPWINEVISSTNLGLAYQITNAIETLEVSGTFTTASFWACCVFALKGLVMTPTLLPGPLIASLTGSTGFDPYGNQYLEGAYAYGSASAAGLSVQGTAGALAFYTGSATAWGNSAEGIVELGFAAGEYNVNVLAAGGLYINGVGPVTP